MKRTEDYDKGFGETIAVILIVGAIVIWLLQGAK